ncbi:MAG: fatty acid desaturase, partial [Planctomycetota bacterium]|nr:fatty acid desaturase [Planctomycetota bacterium]
RYLTHQSMKLKSPAEFFVLMCGALSGEGSSFHWTATHRVHHQKSDQKGDPHSPREGAWWSHLLWLFPDQPKDVCQQLYQTYIPDLINRPLVRFFERTYVFWLISPVFVVGAAGWFLDGWFGMLSLVCWGVCARTTFTYHSTWFVNSATHLWGYKNYETRDDSRNLWWVALVSYGEGWHNNHHAHPRLAPAGHRWWEVDVTWWAIRALQLCGQATDVRDNIPHRTVQPAVDVSAKAPKGSPSSSPSPSTKV